MARYIREVCLNQPEDFVNFMMNDFLTKHGFRYVQFKGEMVYRSGDGFLVIPKLFTWNYQNGVIHVEAWTRNAWLPGVYGRENALTGYMGCVPKKAYKKDVDQLLQLLLQPVPQQNVQPAAEGGTAVPMQPNGPILVQGVDTSRYANLSLGLGIAGLVFFCVPYVALIWGILAVVYANKGSGSAKSGRATAGLICGIIAIVLAAILILLEIFGFISGEIF